MKKFLYSYLFFCLTGLGFLLCFLEIFPSSLETSWLFFPLSLSASGLCPSALYQVQGAVFHSLAASSDRLLLDKKRRDFSPVQPYVPKD